MNAKADWREPSDYEFPDSDRPFIWAWQFLRRNRDYQRVWAKAYSRYLKAPERIGPPLPIDEMTDEYSENFSLASPEDKADAAEFGLARLIDPRKDCPWPLPAFISSFAVEFDSEYTGNIGMHLHMLQDSAREVPLGCARFTINLRRLGNQVERQILAANLRAEGNMYRSFVKQDRFYKKKTNELPSSGMLIELGSEANALLEGYARITVNLFRLGNQTYPGVVVNALVREYERYSKETGQRRFNGRRPRIKESDNWVDLLRVYDAVAEGLSFSEIGHELCPDDCGQTREYLADKKLRARYKSAVDLIDNKGYLDFIAENLSMDQEGDLKERVETAT